MSVQQRAASRRLSACLMFVVAGSLRVAHAQLSEAGAGPIASEPARASSLSESLSGDAKRDYELGRLLYANGDFAGAELRFESARQASGDARLSWNVAVCQKALRQYANAAASMRAFLEVNSARIDEATRVSARDFALAAESLTSPLIVTSNVPGAELYVDSESLGQLPLREPLRIDWGAHQILVKMPGYIGYTQNLKVASASVTRVAAVLRPVVHQGRIIVRAGRNQAIWIDGKKVAWGSWEGVLTSGRHSLRVNGVGYRAHERQVVITDDQTQGFDIVLESAPRSGLPTWVWLVGASVLAAGAVTAGYLVFKPDPARAPTQGSLATIHLELH